MTPATPDPHTLSVAPMMDWTDRHCRFFLRLISKRVLLYTEMITTAAILHGNQETLLGYHALEHPLVLQLGGDDPGQLAQCARIAEDLGYDEVNLNVGCPSDRVQNGHFGACLMRRPEVVAAAVAAIRARVRIPVTVKHRIGVDELDAYEDMARFVAIVAEGGCETFTVHARKAWLKGLSPKENRDVPPLRYDDVYRLKRDFPHLRIEINGGIETLEQAITHLRNVDGVMMGRAVYHNPFLLADADRILFKDVAAPRPTREEVIEQLIPYVEALLASGQPLTRVTRHILGLFYGRPRARAWKRHLSENACRPGAGTEVLRAALAEVRRPLEPSILGGAHLSAPPPTPLHPPPET